MPRTFFSHISIVFIILFGMFSFNGLNSCTSNQNINIAEMNYEDYTDLWKIFENLKKDGKFRDALSQLDKIETKAIHDKNHEQLLKSLFQRLPVNQQIEETPVLNQIAYVQAKRPEFDEVSGAIADSYLAELYNNYLRNNSYKIGQLTNINSAYPKDLTDWSSAHFILKINELYKRSLSVKTDNIPLNTYNAIIEHLDSKEGVRLRPTLFDLLAHRAIDFYTSARSTLTEPIYAFEFDQEEAFLSSDIFRNAIFESKDTSSYTLFAVKTFQQLEREHAKSEAAILLDIILKRLSYSYQNNTNPLKNSWYKDQLEKLLKKYDGQTEAFDVAIKLVDYYISQGNQYDLDNKSNSKELVQAMDLLNDLRKKYTTQEQIQYIDHFEALIKERSFTLTTEEVIPSGENILVQIQYKNIEQLEYEVYALSFEDLLKYYTNNRKDTHFISKSRRIRTGSISLIPTEDYRFTRAETGIEKLEQGSYIVVFKTADNKLTSKHLVHVSNLSYTYDQSGLVQTFHRITGEALPTKIDGYRYDWSGRNRNLNRIFQASTDGQGKYQCTKEHQNPMLSISTENDYLFLNNYIHSGSQQADQNRSNIVVFTDRSIYRPGQKVYFKAIVDKQKNGDDPILLSNTDIYVRFLDANYQLIEKRTLKTNAFGSIHDSFDIPKGLLNGNYIIQFGFKENQSKNQTYIKVEEYKRPKFSIKMDPLKGVYSLDKSIQVSGVVSNYSGSAIADAEVNYTIKRTPVYRYYYRGYFNRQSSKIIKRGTTSTDDTGAFNIDFIAESDKSFTMENPVFNYEVITEITDNSGETRSETTQVKAGAKAYIIDMQNELSISPSSTKSLNIALKNQNNVPAKATVQIKISKHQPEDKSYRKRYWGTSEHYLISSTIFKNDYPSYRDLRIEPNKEVLVNESIDINDRLEYDLSKLSEGVYTVEISNPDAVSKKSELTIIGTNNVPKKAHFKVDSKKQQYLPGENIELDLYTAYSDLDVQIDVRRHGGQESRQLLKINQHERVEFPVSKSDQGGIQIVISATKNSRFYQEVIQIDVPYEDKKLQLKWLSFRSDLYPGSKEKWQLKLSDIKGAPVNAEILSSMYDASLDAFTPHQWTGLIQNKLRGWLRVNAPGFKASFGRGTGRDNYIDRPYKYIQYPVILTLGNQYGVMMNAYRGGVEMESAEIMMDAPPQPAQKRSAKKDMATAAVGDVNFESDDTSEEILDEGTNGNSVSPGPALRTNLEETVFFYPELRTNENGECIIEFTMNEALTKWKLQTFAHTKDAAFTMDEQFVTTSKDLMVYPNGPRFFRQGDRASILAKVQNNTEDKLWAKAYIKFINPFTNEDITNQIMSSNTEQSIELTANKSSQLQWEFMVPADIEGLTYQVYAESEEHTDGEENTALVLSNRTLVTESLAISLAENSSKTVEVPTIEKLDKSTSMEAQFMDISVTSNPSWLAVQSLPYLIEYQYNCSEQIFSRYFGNALAKHILDKNPIIEDVYQSWKENGNLESPLTKNQDLKSAVIEQTPWLLDALSEEEQMQRMSILFDQARIKRELAQDLKTLKERQNRGGFPWFPGGRPNWFITQHILEGIGQLDKMQVIDKNDPTIQGITRSAMQFVQESFIEYDNKAKDPLYLSPIVIHFMYVQSFFPEYSSDQVNRRLNKYIRLAKEKWLDYSLMSQGHLALYFDRKEDVEFSQKIIESLRQRSIYKENLGRYWKEVNGYHWNQSNIERQSLLISAFEEIDRNVGEINEMKQWLLSNKQTNSWKSTKATTQAIYAIVERGDKWIDQTKTVQIKVNNVAQKIPDNQLVEATGEYSLSFKKEAINSDLKSVEFINDNNHIAWASTSVQYWEDLDKIENYQETPLKLRRNYFKKVSTDAGYELMPLKNNEPLKTGEILTVRLTLDVDRPMEYIHLQDMRAAGTEPIDVLSGYRWSSGLGYYMETRDIATNFFVDYLPSGTYTLEYDQRIVQPGNYSAGISTLQSMYAPEFGAHSKGQRLMINGK